MYFSGFHKYFSVIQIPNIPGSHSTGGDVSKGTRNLVYIYSNCLVRYMKKLYAWKDICVCSPPDRGQPRSDLVRELEGCSLQVLHRESSPSEKCGDK